MLAKHRPKKSSIKLSPESRERSAAAALEHPDLGVRRLASMLKGEGVAATEGTVRTVLKKQNLHTRELRLKLLEERHLNQGLILSGKQNRALHDFNPCLRERQLESHRPGLMLVQDIVDLGNLENIGPDMRLQVFKKGYGDTGLFSTVTDIARFLEALTLIPCDQFRPQGYNMHVYGVTLGTPGVLLSSSQHFFSYTAAL